jgi:hypothetical protein
MKSDLIVACVAVAALFSTASAEATPILSGQTVSVFHHTVDTLSNVINDPTVTVIAPGVATGFAGFLQATYTDNQIFVSQPIPLSSTGFLTKNFFTNTPFVFNGLEFSISNPVLTSVVLDPLSTITGGVFSSTASTISLDLRGLTFNTGDTLILDLTGSTAHAVPEPGTLSAVLIGFGAMGVAARRRRLARSA